MFISKHAKLVSTRIRQYENTLMPEIAAAYERAAVGCKDEVRFFDQLITELANTITSSMVPGVYFSVRIGRIHQKPIVKYIPSGGTTPVACELGDLLIVIKYHLLDGRVEKKSIIYQVKMAGSKGNACSIDRKQLELLRDWPPFSFGRAADGTIQTYTIEPLTLEFGSYMLEPRGAARQTASPTTPYGSAPDALCVSTLAGGTAPVHRLSYTRGDTEVFFSHLVFERGEHHDNAWADTLVNALYRYVGMEPDPPGEFDGFVRDPDNRDAEDENGDEDRIEIGEDDNRQSEDDGVGATDDDTLMDNELFAILEVNAIEGEELGLLAHTTDRPLGSPGAPWITLKPGEVTVFEAKQLWRTEKELEAAEAEEREREAAENAWWYQQQYQQQYQQPQQQQQQIHLRH